MSDFKVGDRVRFKESFTSEIATGALGKVVHATKVLTTVDLDGGGGATIYNDHVDCYLEHLSAEAILSCAPDAEHAGEIANFMLRRAGIPARREPSDFKVGDVVRCNVSECPCDHQAETVLEVLSWGVKVTDGSICQASSLSLVSRPGDPLASIGYVNGKPPPALKVGDRVRIIASGGKDIGREDMVKRITPYPGNGHPNTRPHYELREVLGLHAAHELELLPPEPTKPPMRADEFHLLRRPEPQNQKPMTATEASIRAQNAKAPPEYRYTGKELDERLGALRCARDAIARDVQAMANKLVKSDGWMPAGTYMPIQREPRKLAHKPRRNLAPQNAEPRSMLDLHEDGNASTLATKNLSKPRFPERTRLMTRSWDPYSEYDLLPDAD